ncbi:transposase [Streptosporangium brasiliense]|uniref:Transposase n=1 Tax=Streptosporangium brasiliense TaxID=47480 RepID=A0ABT9RKP8_9ACTN|nr:transposase [Streptosporangium brasiliense]
MTHRNSPLSVEGRRRPVERCRSRPISHVATEMGISRATASKWVNRYRQFSALGLVDRPSTPHRQPTATPGDVVVQIETMRRSHKWSAARTAFELSRQEVPVSRRTVSRVLAQLQLNRRRFIDPSGESNREPQQIVARRPGHMVHIDVKKVGRIPDGGGWRPVSRPAATATGLGRAEGPAHGCGERPTITMTEQRDVLSGTRARVEESEDSSSGAPSAE